MREQKLYPHIRLAGWARTGQVIAVVGFGYCLLITAGYHFVYRADPFGFALLCLTPAFGLVAPLAYWFCLLRSSAGRGGPIPGSSS